MPFPASKKRIEQAGERIANGVGTDEDLYLFDATLDAYDELRHEVWQRLQAIPWAKYLGRATEIEITSRTKTRATLLEKLLRQPQIKLPAVRDVCGARIVADVSLGGQDLIADRIEASGLLDSPKRIDRRLEPVQGYRALHVTGTIDSMHVEIQIRTLLQAAWANLYESLGDRWGREIRYGVSDDTQFQTEPPPEGWTTEGRRAQMLHMLRVVSIQIISVFEEHDQDRLTLLRSALHLPAEVDSRLRQALRNRRLVSRYEDLEPLLTEMDTRIEGTRTKLTTVLQAIERSGQTLTAMMEGGVGR